MEGWVGGICATTCFVFELLCELTDNLYMGYLELVVPYIQVLAILLYHA